MSAAEPLPMDLDVTVMPNSLRARIAALEIGESICQARRFTMGTVSSEQLAKARRSLQDIARPAMNRARNGRGHVYTGEELTALTASGDPVVLFLITRRA